jgi:hypothetical protein
MPGTECIRYEIYGADGVYKNSIEENVLKTVPLEVKPIGNDLVRNLKKPLKKYTLNINSEFKLDDINDNASFEFEATKWNIVSPYTFDSDAFNGDKSLRFTDVEPNSSSRTLKVSSINTTSDTLEGREYVLEFSVKILNNTFPGSSPGYTINFFIENSREEIGVTNYYYWNTTTKSFDTNTAGAITWNSVSYTASGEWQKFKITTDQLDVSGLMRIGFTLPYTTSTDHIAMLLDTCKVTEVDGGKNINTISSRLERVNYSSSDVLEHDEIYQGNVANGYFSGNFLPTIVRFKRAQDSEGKTIEEIATQQRINDFRGYSKNYEGSFYNAEKYSILSMHHKVFFDFLTLRETDSCIIDSIKYSVKSNKISLLAHIPENYIDETDVSYKQLYLE